MAPTQSRSRAFWDLSLKLSPEVLAAVRMEPVAARFRCLLNDPRRSLQRDRCRSRRAGPHHPAFTWGSELVARMKAANIALIPTLKRRFELVRAKQSDASTGRVRAERR